jgi:hypothetical protein
MESVAALHARLRWLGIVLFGVALVGFALTVGAVVTGRAPGGRIVGALLGMGLSLASFGTNNDTALHAMAELARKDLLPSRFAAEWAHEVRVRPDKARHPHAMPRMALAFPLFATPLVLFVLWRALTAWGLLP